ncbi:winged helix-turn-helix domain-containing protein [Pseudogemmobacter bohemicus]|uniref:winged helix-turn-helix domain-containing protein n=1 Tax=Pseudogemmobacter bohemicus TaxID=2250708 RepID=UPI000DD3587F|nr:crosslink repair DNA glycosylase YcaQ family protein [Pseudogemmobacter bohemicus]
MSLPILSNQTARRIFLDRHALAEAPTGPATGAGLAALIDRIGFVQIDSIATVGRAHDMILHARRQSHRPDGMKPLIERDRHLWEHWTHDASVLPVSVFPHWHHRFDHNRKTLVKRWTGWQKPGFEAEFDRVLQHVSDHGPVTAADFSKDSPREKGSWWDWHPSKAALEYLWHSGALAITRRDAFRKVYDLTERVIPVGLHQHRPDREETTDWACRSALDRLGFATSGEIAAYWRAISSSEAQAWCQAALARGEITKARIEGWQGQSREVFLWPQTLTEIPPEPPGRVRILSPFDPALRDRKRAEFLFGFFYRIEIYVPEEQRQYGYYVFPVLEGDRIIGRIDVKAFRAEGCLRVTGFWPEPGIRIGAGRRARLEAELERLARFAGCAELVWHPGWDRSAA